MTHFEKHSSGAKWENIVGYSRAVKAGNLIEIAGTTAIGENGEVVVDGAMSIRDLNRAMDWSLPDEEANTIAGLVIHEAQMIPTEGQVFSFHGFRFEVASRKENRLTRLKIRPL